MKVKVELTSEEFDMLCDKIKHMRCIVRDSNDILSYEDYCTGECGLGMCEHPEFCNPVEWLKSKIIETSGNGTEMKYYILASVSADDLNEDGGYTIPSNITTIGYRAFSELAELKRIEIPNSVKSIESWAFSGCENLEEVILPEGLTDLQTALFKGCKSLKKITIPESVKNLHMAVFIGCENLEEIHIKGAVKYIGSTMFIGCSNLKKVTLAHPCPSNINGSYEHIFGKNAEVITTF